MNGRYDCMKTRTCIDTAMPLPMLCTTLFLLHILSSSIKSDGNMVHWQNSYPGFQNLGRSLLGPCVGYLYPILIDTKHSILLHTLKLFMYQRQSDGAPGCS